MPQFVPEMIEVAFDGAGNRVYAYATSSNIRIVRTDPTARPTPRRLQERAGQRAVGVARGQPGR